MKKEVALKIIIDCALKYKQNLENQNYLFVFSNPDKIINYFEAVFLPRNFKHLTGIKNIRKRITSSVEFYELCTKKELKLDDFELSNDGTTILKLAVLPLLMDIHKNAKMIGDYDHFKVNLRTKKLAGSLTACLGFVCENEYYIPNTVLNQDIRDIAVKPLNRIIAIYSKTTHDPLYTRLRYLGKGITPETLKIPGNILEKIDITNLQISF